MYAARFFSLHLKSSAIDMQNNEKAVNNAFSIVLG